MNGNVLANCIGAFHVLVVLFVILAPFSNVPAIILLHIVFGVNLIIHWANNSDVCSLSLLEANLRGEHYTQSFMHRLISPIYHVTESNWSLICYVATIGLIALSAYALYRSKKVARFRRQYAKYSKRTLEKTKRESLSWGEWCGVVGKCLHIILT